MQRKAPLVPPFLISFGNARSIKRHRSVIVQRNKSFDLLRSIYLVTTFTDNIYEVFCIKISILKKAGVSIGKVRRKAKD